MITRKVGMNNFFVSEVIKDNTSSWGVLNGNILIARGHTVDEAIEAAKAHIKLNFIENVTDKFISMFKQIKHDIETEPFQFSSMEWTDDQFSISITNTGKELLLKASTSYKVWGVVEIKNLDAINTGLNKLKQEIKKKYQEVKKGLDEDIETLEALRTTAGKIEDREDVI
jgi:hypothetical protein